MIDLDSRGEVVDELLARVVDGKLEPLPGNRASWARALKRHEGKGQLRVAISRMSERRSAAQNRLLWGVVYLQILDKLRELAFEVGETCPFRDEEDLHAAMKHRFIGPTVLRVAGEEFEVPPSSRVLDVGQFSAFIRQVTEFWALKGIYVEMPEGGS